VAVVLVVVVPGTVALLLLRGGGSPEIGSATEPPTPLARPTPDATSTSEATPPPTPPAPLAPSEGEGGLAGMLEELLGGMDVGRLAACTGLPSGAPAALPEDPDAAIRAIADQVAAERGLEFTDEVDLVLLPPEELRDRVVELSEGEQIAASSDADERLLAALGAIPPDTDLQALQTELLGEQVGGFYDPETGELVALAAGGLDPAARMIVAHEVDHALTDQAIGLPDLDAFAGRADQGLATLAVVEGDASLLMQRWATQQLSLLDQLAAASASLGPAAELQSAPWVLQQQLSFPYTTGLAFTCDQFASGGWTAVDALYADPPTTTAQVLWPERFRAGEEAVDVDDPTLPDGWQEVRRDQLGAADLLWLFQAPGDDRSAALDRPDARARAWAGGELALGTRDGATAVSISLAEHADAPVPLCDSMTAWYDRAFPDATSSTNGTTTRWTGPRQTAAVSCEGDRVDLVIGPPAG
jgi:hypothetical protein